MNTNRYASDCFLEASLYDIVLKVSKVVWHDNFRFVSINVDITYIQIGIVLFWIYVYLYLCVLRKFSWCLCLPVFYILFKIVYGIDIMHHVRVTQL